MEMFDGYFGFDKLLKVGGICAVLTASSAHAATLSFDPLISSYTVIANGGPANDTLNFSEVELGAIDILGTVGDPGSVPSVGASGGTSPGQGISLDGNVAVTNPNGNANLSNVDIHAESPVTLGSRGIDCRGDCSSGSNTRFNTLAPTPSFSNLTEGNGVNSGVGGLGTLFGELQSFENDVLALSASDAASTFTTSSAGALRNHLDNTTFGSGLHLIDIDGSGEFELNNSFWTFSGEADSFFVVRLDDRRLKLNDARVSVAGDLGLNNVLFLTDSSDVSFDFSNVIFNGISFHSIGTDGLRSALFSNVQGCGQVVSGRAQFSNTSLSNCAFAPLDDPLVGPDPVITPVPLPAGFPLLLAGLAVLGLLNRSKS